MPAAVRLWLRLVAIDLEAAGAGSAVVDGDDAFLALPAVETYRFAVVLVEAGHALPAFHLAGVAIFGQLGQHDVHLARRIELLHDASVVQVPLDDGFPFFLAVVDARVDPVGGVVVGGLDDPGVLGLLDLVDRIAFGIRRKDVGAWNVLVDEGTFLIREECPGLRAEERDVHHLGMHHGGAEVADQAHLLSSDRVDQVVAFARMLQDLARDRAAVDRMHGPAVVAVDQLLPVETQLADIDETRRDPRLFESLDEAVEVAEDTAFLEVDDGDMGVFDGILVGAVDAHESLDPAVDELETLDFVALREFLEGVGKLQGLRKHEVAAHRSRSVGIELAELIGEVVFVQEDVEAAHGKKLVVVAGKQDQLFGFRREVEHGTVAGVVQELADDLA